MMKYILALLLLFSSQVYAQHITVLPSDKSFSSLEGPQGAFRYQRQFYLIDSTEMRRSGILPGTLISSIGFTIGAAQNTNTSGDFQLWLQNTSDTSSRYDKAWTTVQTTAGFYKLTGLFPGTYEYEVISGCASPIDTGRSTFKMNKPGECFSPTTFTTSAITTNTATFNWIESGSTVTKYVVEWKTLDSDTWTADSNVTGNLKTVGGLLENTNYEWRVRTLCSGGQYSPGSSSNASFTTASTINCAVTLSGLFTASPADSSVMVAWGPNASANYYHVRYKRTGTTDWTSAFAGNPPLTIQGLNPGTSYQWQVAAGCSNGQGIFTNGSTFTTTGTGRCFSPVNLTADSITTSDAKLRWLTVPGTTTYTIRYRLRESIEWSNVTAPMAQVSVGVVTLTTNLGAYHIPFTSGNTFTYTGVAMYVAWQYTNTATTTSSLNTSLTNARDSVIMSFAAPGEFALMNHSPKLLSTNHRPETHFGSSSFIDNAEVSVVYALGNHSIPFSNSSRVSALVTNPSAITRTYTVDLTVKSTASNLIRHTESATISLTAGSSGVVTFTGYVPTILEQDSIVVSIAPVGGENVLGNNSNYYIQTVTNNLVGYPDGSGSITEAGFGPENGLIANRYTMNGCGRINSAQIFLTNDAVGRDLKAVVKNAAGVVLATSPTFKPDSTQINHYHTFYFANPPVVTNADYFVGLEQAETGAPLFPVGTQYEHRILRKGAYYRDKLDGNGPMEVMQVGRYMIKAEVVPSFQEPIITGDLLLCSGQTSTLTAKAVTKRWANSVIAFSSQTSKNDFSAEKALGTPDVLTPGAISPNAWVAKTQDATREYLVLGYPNYDPIDFIEIYQNENGGAVDTVFAKDNLGVYQVVYQATAAPSSERVKRISIPQTAYNVSEIRIAFNSAAVPGFNTIDAVAIGRTNESPAFTYSWQPSGATTQSISVSSSGAVTLTVSGGGCTASVSAQVIVVVPGTITVTASGSTTFCSGDSILLTSSSATGNLWSNGKTSSSIYAKDPGSYSVSVHDGCATITSNTIVVTWKPIPVVTITGNLSICPGRTTTLDAGNFVSYDWSNGANTRMITVSSPGLYTVRVLSADGCLATASVTTALATNPVPVISGNLLLCPNGGTTVLDAGAGYTTYLWSTGATSRTITVTTTGTYSVTVTNSGGCSGGADVSTTLLTAPLPVIVGPTGFCPGGSSTISVMQTFSAYLWTNGSTLKTTSVNSAGMYSVTVTDANGCKGTASRFMTQLIPPNPVITGTLSFCGGSSTVLDAGLGYASYLWSNGATTHSIIATTVATYTVTVTNQQGCSGTTAVTTTINGAVPPTPGPVAGQTTGLCSTVGNIYSIAPVPNSSYYVWTVPANAILFSGQGTTSIIVKFNSLFSTGNITVRAANACGISPTLNMRTLTVYGAPDIPGSITGQASGVCGTTKTYSIATVAGTNTYTWNVPAGVTIASGQGTRTLTVNFPVGFVSGNICVTASNGCGSSLAKCMALQGLPLTPGPITGPAMVCARTNNVVYATNAVPGATAYTWTVPSGWTIVSGQNTVTLTVNVGTKAGNITVKATNACGSTPLVTLAVQAKCPTTMVLRNDDPPTTQEEAIYQVLAYPNPTTGAVTLAFTNAKFFKQQLKVIDARGRVVYSKEIVIENDMVTLDLGFLVKGVYTLWIYSRTEQKSIKLVKL